MSQEPGSSPNVIAVVGSPRPAGNTAWAVDTALAELRRHGVHGEKLSLSDYRISPCLGHDDCALLPECPLEDDADRVLDKVYAAEGLILATPVYYEDVSAQMKTFIDRNYRRYEHDQWLRPKAVGLIVISAESGIDETVAALKRYLELSWKQAAPVEVATGLAGGLGEASRSEKLRLAVTGMAERMARHLLAS